MIIDYRLRIVGKYGYGENLLFVSRETCANGIFTSPPYQDNFFQGLDERLK
jgi:hypothetical protein